MSCSIPPKILEKYYEVPYGWKHITSFSWSLIKHERIITGSMTNIFGGINTFTITSLDEDPTFGVSDVTIQQTPSPSGDLIVHTLRIQFIGRKGFVSMNTLGTIHVAAPCVNGELKHISLKPLDLSIPLPETCGRMLNAEYGYSFVIDVGAPLGPYSVEHDGDSNIRTYMAY